MSAPAGRPARTVPDPLDASETLAIERGWLTRAGIFAVLAGILPIAATILQVLSTSGATKSVRLVHPTADAIVTYAAGHQGAGGIHGLQAARTLVRGDHAALLIGSAALTGLGLFLAAPVLYGLLRSAWRRRPGFPRWFVWVPVVGAVVFGVVNTTALTYTSIHIANFAALPEVQQTNAAASDAINSQGDLSGLLIVGVLGQLLFAVGLGAAGLSAMNVGLLTRVMGIIAVVLAVLVVLPVVDQQGFLRAFWFIALGLLLLGRLPGGRTPAWSSGEPMPWPTRAEMAEAAARARQEKGDAAIEAASDPAPKPKGTGADNRRKRRK